MRSDISDRKHPPPRREGGEAAESSARSPASPAGPFRLPTCSLALTRSARPRTRGTVHRESRLAFVSSPARSFTPAWTAVPLDVAQRRRAHGRGRSILLPPVPMEHADNFDEPARTPLAMPATQVRDDAAQGPLPGPCRAASELRPALLCTHLLCAAARSGAHIGCVSGCTPSRERERSAAAAVRAWPRARSSTLVILRSTSRRAASLFFAGERNAIWYAAHSEHRRTSPWEPLLNAAPSLTSRRLF